MYCVVYNNYPLIIIKKYNSVVLKIHFLHHFFVVGEKQKVNTYYDYISIKLKHQDRIRVGTEIVIIDLKWGES